MKMLTRCQTLRALVTERLTAAAEEIFVLVERTIAEYEEELCRFKEKNQRQQQLLDQVRSSQRDLTLKEEQDIKQEEDLFQQFTTGKGQLPQTESQEETQEEECKAAALNSEPLEDFQLEVEEQVDLFSETDNDDDWEPAASTSATQKETKADSRTLTEAGQKCNDSKTNLCPFCKRSFQNPNDCKRHILIHTGERPFSCSVCNKGFIRKDKLNNHMKTHTGERPFICTVCHKGFTQKAILTNHMRTHSGVRLFSCSVCNKSFYTKSNLSDHMRAHVRGKPFSCSVCSKSFFRQRHLTEHMKSHKWTCAICNVKWGKTRCSDDVKVQMKMAAGFLTQMDANLQRRGRTQCHYCGKLCRSQDMKRHVLTHRQERPFICSLCNKDFCRKIQLTNHLLTHLESRPYRCPVCDRSFTEEKRLTNHMMTHSGERPFRCTVCNRGYIQKAMLNRHMKTHSEVKPFRCLVCSKGFYRRHSLIRHMKTHPGIL